MRGLHATSTALVREGEGDNKERLREKIDSAATQPDDWQIDQVAEGARKQDHGQVDGEG